MNANLADLGAEILFARWNVMYVETWEAWERRQDAELWEAVALMCEIDPASISEETRLLGPEFYRWRLQLALDWLTRLGPIKFNTKDPVRSVIRLNYFNLWAAEMGLHLPKSFPTGLVFVQTMGESGWREVDPVEATLMPEIHSGPPVQWRGDRSTVGAPLKEPSVSEPPSPPEAAAPEPGKTPERPRKSKGRHPTADAEFLRTADVLALLQISRATLYRYIKDGKLPAPDNPSGRISRWNRVELLDAWKKAGHSD